MKIELPNTMVNTRLDRLSLVSNLEMVGVKFPEELVASLKVFSPHDEDLYKKGMRSNRLVPDQDIGWIQWLHEGGRNYVYGRDRHGSFLSSFKTRRMIGMQIRASTGRTPLRMTPGLLFDYPTRRFRSFREFECEVVKTIGHYTQVDLEEISRIVDFRTTAINVLDPYDASRVLSAWRMHPVDLNGISTMFKHVRYVRHLLTRTRDGSFENLWWGYGSNRRRIMRMPTKVVEHPLFVSSETSKPLHYELFQGGMEYSAKEAMALRHK